METLSFSILIMLVLLVVASFIMKLYKKYRLRHYSVPVRDPRKGHRFYMVEMFTTPTYCNIDECNLIHGAKCDTCGICVDDHSMKKANLKIPCKLSSNKDSAMQHHWVRGNLLPYSDCFVCGEECGDDGVLADLTCAWCKNTVHDACASKSEACDLGPCREFIVPPNCIDVKWTGVKGTRQRHVIVKSVQHPKVERWKPLIVIANSKSGSKEGEILLRNFRGVLNPAQVIDIQHLSPENALEWCNLLPGVSFYLLVCGGDGTIGWVLSAIEKLKLKIPPRICILPLGTGNDLARVLGWGEGYSEEMNVSYILKNVRKARPVDLDRWTVSIQNEPHFRLPKLPKLPKQNKIYVMNNYVSIGVDALVTLNFHRQRESWPALFAHRLINKMCYFTFGTKDVLERECKNLHSRLKVQLDDREIQLPELEGIVILNIASWGGGCRPWGVALPEENLQDPGYDDEVLEVMGLFSSFHIAQLQLGLASPLRLGQAKKVKITLVAGKAPMQVDGEPWEQNPSQITISHRGKAAMMALSSD